MFMRMSRCEQFKKKINKSLTFSRSATFDGYYHKYHQINVSTINCVEINDCWFMRETNIMTRFAGSFL